ncbi:hypothetical protein IWZ01DRAFT_90110, partial [Phyllosticta capitalensis]
RRTGQESLALFASLSISSLHPHQSLHHPHVSHQPSQEEKESRIRRDRRPAVHHIRPNGAVQPSSCTPRLSQSTNVPILRNGFWRQIVVGLEIRLGFDGERRPKGGNCRRGGRTGLRAFGRLVASRYSCWSRSTFFPVSTDQLSFPHLACLDSLASMENKSRMVSNCKRRGDSVRAT